MTDPNSVRSDFDINRRGYPELVVRMLAGCFQYRTLPEDLSTEDDMIAHALTISSELNLRVCLVLGPRRAWYCEPDGSRSLSDQPPRGGMLVPEDATFVCEDGTVRTGSPRGPVVRRVKAREEEK